MATLPDGGRDLPSLSHTLSPTEVNMDLTMSGLLPEHAEELAGLYHEHGNWNQVKQIWFEERRANRSTRGSSQKIFRVLTSRLKNAPSSLPNPGDLPRVLDACSTTREKAQILFLYLVTDDPLVRYVLHEYVNRLLEGKPDPLDFSDQTLTTILSEFKYDDGSQYDYAESTTQRWCEGFRSVMREIGVLESQQTHKGNPPTVGDVSLLVALGYSYEEREDNWVESPIGLQYLFQPSHRWDELYDRAAATDAWELVELHGSLQLRPTGEPYDWIPQEGEI